MKEESRRRKEEEIHELLSQYQKLKNGKQLNYLEEEDFERIIDYYDDNNSLQLALEAAEYGIDRFPFSSSLLIKKADLLIALQNFQGALESLNQAKVLDGTNPDLYLLQIEASLGIGHEKRAMEIYEQSMNQLRGRESINFLIDLSEVFDDYGMAEEVFDCLEKVLLADPENQEALSRIPFWADYASKSEESIKLHKYLIDEHPYNYIAWFNLGSAYQSLKLYEKAVDAYLYVTAINDNFEPACRNLGDAYIRLKQYRQAIEILEKILTFSFAEDDIYTALGYCYTKLRLNKKARYYYRKAISLTPEDSQLHFYIAETYMSESKWSNALNHLFRATSIESKRYPNYYFAIGECFDFLGNTEEAARYLGRYIKAKPSAKKGWKTLINALYKGKYYREVLNESDTAFSFTRGKGIFIYYKAAAMLKLGRKQEGLLLLESAACSSPEFIKEFMALDPILLQRPSVTKIINRYLPGRSGKKNRREQ